MRPTFATHRSGRDSVGHGVAFSPDGKRLATSGGDNTVMVWRMPD